MLQEEEEEEENEAQTMDYQEKGKERNSIQGKPNPKRKAQRELVEKEEKEDSEKMENTTMEIDPSKGEELIMEEEVLRKLLNEWRYLDEIFIPEDQKRLYRETVQ